MADQDLRDNAGRLIGKIRMTGIKYEGRDAAGRLKGTYDPKSNDTRDASGKLFGKGNLLSALITQY
ncbi:MAG: hypothetical protein HYR80_09565 [Nitrospirae bacterium]|nr:hypothetical protein [Nitrospirota bacterium]